MTPLRVLFAGTPDVALPALEFLCADPRFEVVGVLTNPDRPRGRSRRPEPSAVARHALAAGLPNLLRPERVGEAVPAIVATGAEVGAVVAYGSILSRAVLDALPLGFVNLHLSLLPRWRGAAPVQHAIRAGDAVTGCSVFRLDEGMDTGPLLRTSEHPIPAGADSDRLLDDLARAGAPLLAEGLLAVAAGDEGVAQPAGGVTLAPRIRTSDAVVDWSASAAEVERHIRSVTSRPGASTTVDAGRIKLAHPSLVDPDPTAAGDDAGAGRVPGTIVGTDGEGIVVACGVGSVRIERVQFSGRPWATGAEQVRGRRLAVGMVLGTHNASS
jgi:methionyl-tRNA formyltransferase